MVRAILAGNKTQTRRVIEPQPLPEMRSEDLVSVAPRTVWRRRLTEEVSVSSDVRCRFGATGDRLWVRETMIREPAESFWRYAADRTLVLVDGDDASATSASVAWAHHKNGLHCPSIHMPRWASRLTLRLTDVRVQGVQEISAEDAAAEGHPTMHLGAEVDADAARDWFSDLWDSINAKRGYSWANNPWVWALTFEVERG
jgi:hypothetical protein